MVIMSTQKLITPTLKFRHLITNTGLTAMAVPSLQKRRKHALKPMCVKIGVLSLMYESLERAQLKACSLVLKEGFA